jgi:aspartate/methionine/tyrosine aminotransferase
MPAERVNAFTESVIREMTRLCESYDAINLAQGFPDFPAPHEIKEAAVQAIRADENQYAITWGEASLRNAIARKMASYNHVPCDPETDVTVTCGATEAMISTLLALVDPGDEVIIFEPYYENYRPDTMLSAARPIYVPLQAPDFTLDRERVSEAFARHPRAIIINTPQNPSGHVFGRAELDFIARLCQQYDTIAVTDEIYEYILYDGHQHVSMASLPGMADRTVTISGLSKTYSVTGWRIGYAVAAPHLTSAIRKVHDFLTVGAPHPLQEAGAVALGFPQSYYEQLRVDYAQRREQAIAALQEAGFDCRRPQGAYYVMCDFSGVTRRLGFSGDDTDFARRLVESCGVAGVPGSSFFHDSSDGENLIRFAFCKKAETLRLAAERLRGL